jgi:hypothetical protein
MGLFGSKKIYVSSSIYNLAGDELDRPNFLKSSLFSAVMNPYDAYLGETIVGNYLTGPGIMQRSFFNWASRNDIAGLPTLKISAAIPIDQAIISPFIPIPASPVGLENRVQSAEFTDGDYGLWAEKWLWENNIDEVDTEWVSDYDADDHEITIQYEGGGTVVIPATNFDKDKKFAIARYYQVVPSEVQPLVVGTKVTDVYSTPSTIGFTLDNTTNTGVVNYTLAQNVEVQKVYSDGSPTTTTNTAETPVVGFNTVLETWGQTEYVGSTTGADDTSNLEKWVYIWERREKFTDSVVEDVTVNDMGGGETETVTTTRSGEFLQPVFDHQEDEQETILDKVDGNGGIWIYEIGTGNATLDALYAAQPEDDSPGYYPFIPIRLNNESITEDVFEDLYTESKKAYKRATGGPMKGNSLDKIIEEVEDNPDIGDIDYSYVQWGVSVNVFDPACRRYMYEWMSNMVAYQNSSPSTMNTFKNVVTNYDAMKATYNAWVTAQNTFGHPLYGTPKPPQPVISEPPSTTVRLAADHPQLGGFDNRFTWVNITETTHTGLGKAGAKEGDIWFEDGESLSWTVQSGFLGRDSGSFSYSPRSLDQMLLYKQTGDNTYSVLTIWGMVHENFIYGGKAVRTTLKEGVNDNAESVFIVPLHAPTVRSLGVKDFTQMALSNTFITFNSYLVVKKKWYQTFLGMLLIVIAIVVVAALIAPAAVGGASGVFGTNAAVGAGLGLSGTGAVVAGAVTNAIAAVVIAQAVGVASVAIFGEKWGAIIGAIVNFAISFGVANGFSNLTLTNMMNPQTILQFSNALANGYAGFVQAEIGEINAEMEENQDAYEKATKDLNDLMRSMGLTNDLIFDPLSLTNSVKGNDSGSQSGTYLPETLDQFIGRTTMTGSDVVDITLSMVSDYSDLQLTLPKN